MHSFKLGNKGVAGFTTTQLVIMALVIAAAFLIILLISGSLTGPANSTLENGTATIRSGLLNS